MRPECSGGWTTFRNNWRLRLPRAGSAAPAATPTAARSSRRSWRRMERGFRMVAGLISTHTARMTRRKKRKISAMTPHCMTCRTAFRFCVAMRTAPHRVRSRHFEDELRRPHADLVPAGEELLPDRGAVHPGAIGGPEIGDEDAVVLPAQLGVAPAHVGVRQDHITLG